MSVSKYKELGSIDLDKINKAYSSEPWWYDIRGYLILIFSYRTTLTSQVRFFAKNIGPKHLEAAVGSGSLLKIILLWNYFFKKEKSKITAFDYAEKMLLGAIKKFKNSKDIVFLLADVSKLPFQADSFDTINIANAFHCLPEVEKSLRELLRVLKPSGTLAGNVLLFPEDNTLKNKIASKINTWGIKKGILIRPYIKKEVIELLMMTGFEIISVESKGNCLSFLAKKT